MVAHMIDVKMDHGWQAVLSWSGFQEIIIVDDQGDIIHETIAQLDTFLYTVYPPFKCSQWSGKVTFGLSFHLCRIVIKSKLYNVCFSV